MIRFKMCYQTELKEFAKYFLKPRHQRKKPTLTKTLNTKAQVSFSDRQRFLSVVTHRCWGNQLGPGRLAREGRLEAWAIGFSWTLTCVVPLR